MREDQYIVGARKHCFKTRLALRTPVVDASRYHINQIRGAYGDLVSDQHSVLCVLEDYCRHLYCFDNIRISEVDNYLTKINLPALSQSQHDLTSACVTAKECSSALNKMPNNKSPGSDGFTVSTTKYFETI